MAKSRRENRAKRVNLTRDWQKGDFDDEHTLRERWTREGSEPRQKVKKKNQHEFDYINSFIGMVLEVHRRTCTVQNLETKELINCRYGVSITTEEHRLPAVGDKIKATKEIISGDFYAVEVLPRKSALVRPGPDDRYNKKLVLAANIDQVVVISSVLEPDFNYGFVDRFLLAANLSNLDLTIILNKIDLVSEIPEELEEFKNVAKIIPISAQNKKGLDALTEVLKDKVSVFSGQSGVGKSTIIRKIIPGLDIKTGEVRIKDGRGRHTTTASSLFELPFGGQVIDTPGIRGLGLLNLPVQELAIIFPGFEDLYQNCKFNDCSHTHEPGCAVIEAIENGKLSVARYHSYLRIMDSINTQRT